MTRRKAPTTYLEPGHHSIERNTPTERERNGKKVFILDWSVRLKDGRLIEKRSQGSSKEEVRRRAKRTAKSLLASGGKKTQWSGTTPVERYLDEVAAKEIEDSGWRDRTLSSYRGKLNLLRRELAGYGIADAMQPDVLTDALKRIAEVNGAEAARQTRIVLNGYVIQPMMMHRLIDRNPIDGARLNLKKVAEDAKKGRGETPKSKSAGGKKGLTAEEQERVIEWLLARNPVVGAEKPARGRWTLDHVIAKRRNALDLIILQAGAAPRTNEAHQITPELLEVDDTGALRLYVTAEIAKTGVARHTPIPDARIAEHLKARREEALDRGGFFIGRPSKPHKRWVGSGNGGSDNVVREFFDEMADELNIPLLKQEGILGHMWRTTLTSRYLEAGVPRKTVAAILGHDEVTSEKHYTDGVDLGAVTLSYQQKHGP